MIHVPASMVPADGLEVGKERNESINSEDRVRKKPKFLDRGEKPRTDECRGLLNHVIDRLAAI